MLKVDGLSWCFEHETLKTEAMNYFNDLFTKEEGVLSSYDCRGAFPILTE